MECRTCQHWKPTGTEDWTAEGVGFGECLGVRERWRIQDEASDKNPDAKPDEDFWEWEAGKVPTPGSREAVRRDALLAARAYVQDGSEYRAELFTAPDFFCALYSPVV